MRASVAAPLGSTPEKAINKAIYEAEISAEGDGLFTCTLVGEPSVWFVPYDSNPGGYYRAAVDMTCSDIGLSGFDDDAATSRYGTRGLTSRRAGRARSAGSCGARQHARPTLAGESRSASPTVTSAPFDWST